jgi:hypothetical protein
MELTKTDKINKYHNGKIYTIRSYQTDKFYIGSTCSPLHKRFYEHTHIKNTSSKILIENYNDCYIELLENFKCESRIELIKREGELIRENLNNVINKSIAGRTTKQYQIENKEKYTEYNKQYKIKNKEKCRQYTKKYNNKEKIKALNKVKFVCECGGTYTNQHKKRHFKTKKHINYDANKNT